VTIDVSGFIDKAIIEAHLLQRRDHVVIAAPQRLGLKVIETFAQLAEKLFQALQETLTLGIHLVAFALLDLLHHHEQASRQQQHGTQGSRDHRQENRAMEPALQGFSGSRHRW
jgi:hypothetical protein